MKEKIGYIDLASSLNLKPDDVLFIGADLTRLAYASAKNRVPFDVNKFIDSFLEQLPNGTLVIPTYTDDFHLGMTFDVRKSKPNIGALAVAAFKRKDAYRTVDPFHSMAVWGKHIPLFESIVDNSTFGTNSAFGLLHQLKAKMLMIDVSLNQNFTFVHYCEEQAKVSWRKNVNHHIHIINHFGVESEVDCIFYTRKMGYINSLDPLETVFEREKIMNITEIFNIPLRMIDLPMAYTSIILDINENNGRNIHQFSIYEWVRILSKRILFSRK
jgi:aminoglycoside 3-N-acetyltransferase